MKVFITGGTSGLGLELAKKYLENGHTVGVCGRDLSKLGTIPEGLFTYEVDVKKRESLINAISSFSQSSENKGLDLMVANAGVSMSSKTRIPNFKDIADVMEINIHGVLFAFEGALNEMEGEGHLVAVSSLAAFNGLPGAGAYSASKSAVRKFCESLAVDFKGTGITVSCICPGFIDTPLTQRNKHPMPFLMSLEDGVDRMYKAIEAKKVHYAFPFPLNLTVKILEIIPRSWYRWIMSFKSFNYSK